MNKTITVIGHTGMVGSTVYQYFNDRGYNLFGINSKSGDEVYYAANKNSDYVFVCVPTAFDWKKGESNYDVINGVMDRLKPEKEDCKIIVKSTVYPGFTEDIQSQRPDLNILFNPEFLSESSAMNDFLNPDRQIVGYTEQSYKYAMDVLNMLPESPYGVIMYSTEAEITKFVNNFHGSLMVIFANFIYDMCKLNQVDYDVVKKASQASKWVGSPMGRMYWDVAHKGFRGYGGMCFPKDMHNLSKYTKRLGINSEILDATIKANKRILAEQGLNEKLVEKR